MALGVLLMMLAGKEGVALPASGDELLPMFAATGSPVSYTHLDVYKRQYMT